MGTKTSMMRVWFLLLLIIGFVTGQVLNTEQAIKLSHDPGMDANADIVQQETSDDDAAPTAAVGGGAPRFAEQSVEINTGSPGSQPLRIPNQETTEGLFHNDA